MVLSVKRGWRLDKDFNRGMVAVGQFSSGKKLTAAQATYSRWVGMDT